MSAVSLTIDGRRVTVAPGTTVLDAARAAGVDVPTLCHVPGLEPVGSCFLCVVQVEGRKGLSPSCALPAAEGMVVTTDSADVRATRRMALELLLSDHAGECSAPCARGCPADLDIPGFTLPLAEGREADAMRVVARTLALPGALGRVCPRLCEEECRRCGFDGSLAIGALHRHVAERDLATTGGTLPPCAPASGRSVAIVGAGPAGLAAAYFLLQRGHACTLFDAHEEPGGMLRYGIPEYRLPRAALAAEVGLVVRLGARLRMGTRWGRDVSLAGLRREHDAVFLAIGAQLSSPLGCPGEELALAGVEFLAAVARGEAPPVGGQVVVIGGGNTAIDAARSALRLARRERADAAEVRVLYRRTRADMPSLADEVEDALAEGVALECATAPVALARGGDGMLELTCVRMRPGGPDASGRARPVPEPGTERVLRASAVIAAVGQRVDLELAAREGLALSGHGVAVDPRTFATSVPGVFAGGDAVLGPDLAVRAVGAGRRAAEAIDQHLRGRPVVGAAVRAESVFAPLDEDELARVFRGVERAGRSRSARLAPARRRDGFDEVDRGLDAAAVTSEARRCLSCGCAKAEGCDLRNLASEYGADAARFDGARRAFDRDESHAGVVYEPGKCIACDACVRVAAAEGEPLGVTLVGRGFEVAMDVPFGGALAAGLTRAAARAVEVCPTGALALRSRRACEACGGCALRVPPGPQRDLDAGVTRPYVR